MSYKNQANVPKCSNKPGGLIKIFVSKIVPSHYGEAILETLEKSSYKHVDDFLSDFYKHVQRSYNTYMKAKDASYLLGDPVPFSTTRPSSTSSSGSSLRKNTSQYQGDSRQEKHTLAGRLHALSARRGSSDDEESCEEDILSSEHLGDEAGIEPVRSLKFSPEELEDYEKQSSISAMNSTIQKPKHDKDTPNGCFHLLFKGECTRKEKCTYSHDPAVMAATHAHYGQLLESSKFKPRSQDLQRPTYGSVRVLQHGNLGAVIDPA